MPSSVSYAGRRHDDNRIGSVGVHWRVDTTERVVALTFDDGPTPAYTGAVLDALAAHDAKATFFVVGQRVHAHPDLVRRAAAAGHEIGNHTWGHADLSTLDERAATHLGYQLVLWSMEFHERNQTSAENAAHLTAAITPGTVVLGHDGGPVSHDVGVRALPALLSGLKVRGFAPVTISELLALAPR